MEPIEQSIDRYPAAMDTADRTQSEVARAKTVRLKDKIEKLTQQMHGLREMEQRLRDAPDGQASLTDPEARSMATSGRGTGIIGCNVQTAARVGDIKAIVKPGRGRRAPTAGWLAPREPRGAHR